MFDSLRTIETLELVGGALCLDFTNTINSRIAPVHDYLASYSGLMDWGAKVGALPADQIDALRARGQASSKQADEAVRHAHVMRDLYYRVFSAVAAGREPGNEDIDAVRQFHAAAMKNGRLVWGEDRYRMIWVSDLFCDTVLWPVATSAVEVLTGDRLGQIKECPGCGWLFIDTSKNQSRRWCSMATCGSRAKMRSYHGKGRK